MRASDLLGVQVYDRDGVHIGAIRDLHLEAESAPVGDSGRPAYRVTAVECGPIGIAHRLGYGHRAVNGPWPLDVLLARATTHSWMVGWHQIATLDMKRITLGVDITQLRHVGADEE
jgi:hypothetical protein